MSGGQTGHMLAARPRADNDDAGGGPPHSKIETTLMCVDELRVEELAEVLERIAERRVTSVADLDNDRQTATPTRRNRRDGPGRSRTSALRRPAEDADPGRREMAHQTRNVLCGTVHPSSTARHSVLRGNVSVQTLPRALRPENVCAHPENCRCGRSTSCGFSGS